MVGLALLDFLVARGDRPSASPVRPPALLLVLLLAPIPTQTDLENTVLLWLVNLARQAAVRQGVMDDELVGFGAGLLVQPGT